MNATFSPDFTQPGKSLFEIPCIISTSVCFSTIRLPQAERERVWAARRPRPTWPAVHFSIPKRTKTVQDEVSIAAKKDRIGISHDAQTEREKEERQSILPAQRILVCHVQVHEYGRRIISIYSSLRSRNRFISLNKSPFETLLMKKPLEGARVEKGGKCETTINNKYFPLRNF